MAVRPAETITDSQFPSTQDLFGGQSSSRFHSCSHFSLSLSPTLTAQLENCCSTVHQAPAKKARVNRMRIAKKKE